MEISTFDDDLLDLSEFGERLRKFVSVEHNFVQGSLVVALTSKYGTGKSTFLRMWKHALEEQDSEDQRPVIVSLNAWESDYYGDPLFAITSSLVDRIGATNKDAEALISAAKDVGWFVTTMGGQVVRKFTGLDPNAAGDVAEKKRTQRSKSVVLSDDAFSRYRERKNAMHGLQAAIRKFVEAAQHPVLFLVDELDRCRPDYAISYLETIKHIFDIKRLVFIVAADRAQLENSAKTTFGANLDFEEYYRKFIHREVALPRISDHGYNRIAETYVEHYLEREGLRTCIMEIDKYRVANIAELVQGLRLTPRQIQEVFRILGHVLETSSDRKGQLRWCLSVGSIGMAAFKVGLPNLYVTLGTGQVEAEVAGETLKRIMPTQFADWWFLLLLTGRGIRRNEEESEFQVLQRAQVMSSIDEETLSRRMIQWQEGWGHPGESRFHQIFQKIESILQWS